MSDDLRDEILKLARQYSLRAETKPFVPNESYIPVSGKVLDGDDLASLIDSSLDLWLTAGRFTKKFEERLAAFTGVQKAIMTVSGSAANLLAFASLTSPTLGDRRVRKGDEVITVAAGFPTTVNPIVQYGCVPVFVDVDLATHNIDVSQLPLALSQRTRAVMIAHCLGNPFAVGAVKDFCAKHNLYLIEDCCDALGATYGGEPVGTFGDAATYSFYPAHHLTTGEGGAICTNNQVLARAITSLRDWGRDCWCMSGHDDTCSRRFDRTYENLPDGYDHKYVYSHIGYNLKATDMQAALGVSQMTKLGTFIEKRRANHARLLSGLRDAGLDSCFEM
ncbi:MAG: lipopolysaccharide biosynthesis protein RfbH, partial [Myxococcota bacterium]|nr:lipopolysaccharide biosynthesis protein RfbH [Myxococcota bacterium]